MLLQSAAISSGAPLPWLNNLGALGMAGLTVMVLARNIVFDPRETVVKGRKSFVSHRQH